MEGIIGVCYFYPVMYVGLYTCMYIALSLSVLAYHYCGLFPDPFRLDLFKIRYSICPSAAYTFDWILKFRHVINSLDPDLFLSFPNHK